MAHDHENEPELRGWLSAYLDPAVLAPGAISRAVVEGQRRLRRRRVVAGGGVAVAMAAATPFTIQWLSTGDGAAHVVVSPDTTTTLPTTLATTAVTIPTESPSDGSQTPHAEGPLRMITRPADDPFPSLFALISGTLVVTADGCLAVAGDDGQSVMAVLWGYGWTAAWEDGVVVVRHPSGAAFARTGERVQLGGGGSNRDDSQIAADYADRLCGVEVFWNANDVQ